MLLGGQVQDRAALPIVAVVPAIALRADCARICMLAHLSGAGL